MITSTFAAISSSADATLHSPARGALQGRLVSPASTAVSMIKQRTAQLVEQALTAFPYELTCEIATWAPHLVSDALRETKNNVELLAMARLYANEKPELLDLSCRKDLDDTTLTAVLQIFPTIRELDIRFCEKAGFDLDEQQEVYDALPNLKILRVGGSGADETWIDKEALFLMQRGVQIDKDARNADGTLRYPMGVLGLACHSNGDRVDCTNPQIRAAIQSGSWSQADICQVLASQNRDALSLIFATGKFDINSPLDSQGNTLYTLASLQNVHEDILTLIRQQPGLRLPENPL